jgi:hypothetical protein
LNLTSDEKLLVRLHAVSRFSDQKPIRATASSLLLWYQRRGEWTYKQRLLAGQLCRGHQRTHVVRKPRFVEGFWLYAVRLGDELKVGMTSDVKKRVASYRIGSSEVELMWEVALGQCSKVHAKNQEKILHKFLRKRRHWLVRELFNLSALADIKLFVPKKPRDTTERRLRREKLDAAAESHMKSMALE